MELLKQEIESVCEDFFSHFNTDDLVVIGCSSSEILGFDIGKHGSMEVGKLLVDTILKYAQVKGVNVCAQGCEHINRSLVIEKEVALQKGYEIVNVIPVANAGGSLATNMYQSLSNPVVVEHVWADGGIDIGDTEIGMHVKFVQVPLRLNIKQIGKARVTALTSRPKYIGGVRARYE